MKNLGYSGIVFGVESGDEKVLTYMNKATMPMKSCRSCLRWISRHTLRSHLPERLGGKGYGLDHAKKTAAVFNQLHPDRILIAGLTIFPDTPLMKDVRSGEFEEATEGERILELKEFLTDLTIDTLIDATNASIITAIYGQIPAQKQDMIDRLQAVYDTYGEQGLRQMRDSLGAI